MRLRPVLLVSDAQFEQEVVAELSQLPLRLIELRILRLACPGADAPDLVLERLVSGALLAVEPLVDFFHVSYIS